MKLLHLKQTPSSSKKKYIAVFDDGKTIAFGSKGSFTYADGADKKVQENYLARHRVNEDWSKVNAGSLSRWVLWSSKSIQEGIKNFNKNIK